MIQGQPGVELFLDLLHGILYGFPCLSDDQFLGKGM
jgi:hypothetical protein